MVYEGPQALAALQRDLLGAGAVAAQEALPEGAEATAVEAVPAAGEAAAGTGAPADEARNSWRDDETKGRRLGDRPVPPSSGDDGVETWLFGEDGFGFDDLIDVINPLQHIPVISSIYRWITGDEISPAANVAGGALFGGPLGLAGAVASVAIEEATGDDLGGHAIAMLFGDETSPDGGSPAPADATNLAALPTPAEADPAAIPELPFFPAETASAALAQYVAEPEAAPSPEAAPRGPVDFPEGPQPAAGASPVMFIPANEALAVAPAAGMPSAGAPDAPMDAAIAAQMMLALDKYEVLNRQRNAAAAGAAASVPGSTAPGSLFDSRF